MKAPNSNSVVKMGTIPGDRLTVPGLRGHWHQSLILPTGYQHFNWYTEGENQHRVFMDDVTSLKRAMEADDSSVLYLYTHHEVFLQEGILKHTRSSPNWEGGLVTYATCKHHMRTYDRGHQGWVGTWLVGLAPGHCANNCLMFVGQVSMEFQGNLRLNQYLQTNYPDVAKVKRASVNPRADLYTPRKLSLPEGGEYDHRNFLEPPDHTRSVETYARSPGTVHDGPIPKWWRDLEYFSHGRRPPVFILSPCWIFSRPLLWTTRKPGRAVLRLTPKLLYSSLSQTAK